MKVLNRSTYLREGLRAAALLTATTLWAFGMPSLCLAQVQLPSVNLGLTNFEDGFGSPGWLFQEFPDFYHAGELKDSYGNALPGSNRVTSYSTTTHLVFVSQERFLGGWLAAEALQPLVDLDIHLANAAASRVRGQADLTVGAGLQWAPRQIERGVFAERLIVDVGLPTGKYNDERPANIGNHLVVINPYYAVTYERDAVEFSARLHYLWNSVNHDPFVGIGARTVQPGQAFHMNYSASYEVIRNVRLGFNGYWLQQFTEDKINGVNLAHSLERTVGLGAGIQIRSGQDTWFHLNGYTETDVRNRANGINVTLRVSIAVPSEN